MKKIYIWILMFKKYHKLKTNFRVNIKTKYLLINVDCDVKELIKLSMMLFKVRKELFCIFVLVSLSKNE